MRLLQVKIIRVCVAAVLGGVAFSSSGQASLITPPLNTFLLSNTSADGAVDIAKDGLSFDLTGGNTGSGIPGTTDFTVVAQSAGTVQFSFYYASLDSPGNDIAGYLLGKTLFPLANTGGQSGTGSFMISPGQMYGWYVNTLDNTGEPGILTVAVPPGIPASPTPEPADFVLTLAGIAALAVTRSRLAGTWEYCKKEAK